MKLNSRLKTALKEVEDKNSFLSAHEEAWEVIRYLLREDLASIEKEIFDEEYELEFSAKQIDRFGQRRALKQLLNIFED